MVSFRALMDVWPKESDAQVFLCLENRKTGALTWIFKGRAKDADDNAQIQDLQEAPIKDVVRAGSVQYVYMDEERARQFQQVKIDRGIQLSLPIT